MICAKLSMRYDGKQGLIALLFALALQTASFAADAPAAKQATAKQAASNTFQDAPVAEEKATILKQHLDSRTDPYFWMKDRKDPKVIKHLERENAFAESRMKSVEALEDNLFAEMKARIKEKDDSVPYRQGDYSYYSRYEAGLEYPIYCRKKIAAGAVEEIILDVNVLAKGKDYFSIGTLEVSPDQKLLAYSSDTVGRRLYDLRVIDLESGKAFQDLVRNTSGEVAWADDNKTLFYIAKNQETLREESLLRHELGAGKDELIFHEADQTFFLTIGRSLSDRFIFVTAESTLVSEVRYLPSSEPKGAFKVFSPREAEHEYSVVDGGDEFFVLSNHGAKNFKVMRAAYGKTERKDWREAIPHRKDILVEDILAVSGQLILQVRQDGLRQLHVYSRPDLKSRFLVDFADPVYSTSIHPRQDFTSGNFRYLYQSLTRPASTYDLELKTKRSSLLKQEAVLGGFDPADYRSERLFAPGRDGVKIPVSVVYHKDTPKGAKTPLLLYGYGAYGYAMEAGFSSARLSLLNRGFIYAIAHVRGGSELGRSWYEDGKMLKKKNTFEDFISAGEFLISKGYTSKEHLYAQGGSAGGLLIGAVMNMRPDLFHGMMAAVPFVDVLTTMLDDSIPLTTFEYDEWGNPAQKVYYDYIKSYSPYDNVRRVRYPNLLVTTGLHDSQVQYWEPAKWVAKIRAMKEGDSLVLFKTDMSAGHSGKSGRFKRLEDTATEFAFLCMLEGLTK